MTRLSLTKLFSAGLATGMACADVAIGASAALAYDHEGLARAALENHIRPGYAAFDRAAAKLSSAATELCSAPSAKRLNATRAAFGTAVLSWARMEHIRFGPIADEKRHDRLMFWPDPKGIARKQVDALLKSPDAAPFENGVAAKSVAVQGFTALDAVLFGPGSEGLANDSGNAALRCRYAMAVTQNIASVANAATQGWAEGRDFPELWLRPGPQNTVYLSSKETTQALLQAYLTGVEQARNQRLTGPLGMQRLGAKALEPMLPDSRLALAYLQANIEGLRSLLSDGGFIARQTEPPTLDQKKQVMTVLGSIKDELTRAGAAANAAAKLSSTPFKDDAAREKLISMGFPLKNAYETGGRTIADEASLTMGFNGLDGD